MESAHARMEMGCVLSSFLHQDVKLACFGCPVQNRIMLYFSAGIVLFSVSLSCTLSRCIAVYYSAW